MDDNEDLLDNLADAIRAINVAMSEVSVCRLTGMVDDLADMRDTLDLLLEKEEEKEKGRKQKGRPASLQHRQAARLIAMARQLMAGGDFNP